MQVAKVLGAVYYRPSSAIFLDEWNGSCSECAAALGDGFRLVLTVRANGRGQATSPVSDLAGYQRTLGQVLDKYRPAVLVIENEENSALFYTGTPQEYAAQLKAACQVAHAKGIPCTNGGLVSILVALLVYHHYLESGQMLAAQNFAARVFTPQERPLLNSPKAQEQIRKGKALLASYRAAGADYVNFHWYIADTKALEEAVAYLKAETGLPVMTSEMGQHNDDPNQTTAVMAKVVELGLPMAVWFSVDAAKARALVNPDGSLRPTGEAFQRFIREHFRPHRDMMDFRARLTPEVRACILQRLGRREARRVAEEIRMTGKVDPNTWTQIAPCWETVGPPMISPTDASALAGQYGRLDHRADRWA
jgi:hypothetical protein